MRIEPKELRSLDYCMTHKERHIIGHGGTEHHEGAPCNACDYLDAAAEYRSLFDVQSERTTEAIKLWRAESPDERELVQPDLGTLLAWLIRRAERSLGALEQIKREEGKVCGEYETCEHRACHSSYAAWAIADAALRRVERTP